MVLMLRHWALRSVYIAVLSSKHALLRWLLYNTRVTLGIVLLQIGLCMLTVDNDGGLALLMSHLLRHLTFSYDFERWLDVSLRLPQLELVVTR